MSINTQTMPPEVAEAIDYMDRCGVAHAAQGGWSIIRAHLHRLAEENAELHAAIGVAEPVLRGRAETAEAELAALKARTIVSLEMVHEAEAHVPCALHGPERWEWLANFFNRALTHPGVPCPCCGVAPNGEIYDHLTPEQWREMQPKEES